jgi:hypothetical protein
MAVERARGWRSAHGERGGTCRHARQIARAATDVSSARGPVPVPFARLIARLIDGRRVARPGPLRPRVVRLEARRRRGASGSASSVEGGD